MVLVALEFQSLEKCRTPSDLVMACNLQPEALLEADDSSEDDESSYSGLESEDDSTDEVCPTQCDPLWAVV